MGRTRKERSWPSRICCVSSRRGDALSIVIVFVCHAAAETADANRKKNAISPTSTWRGPGGLGRTPSLTPKTQHTGSCTKSIFVRCGVSCPHIRLPCVPASVLGNGERLPAQWALALTGGLEPLQEASRVELVLARAAREPRQLVVVGADDAVAHGASCRGREKRGAEGQKRPDKMCETVRWGGRGEGHVRSTPWNWRATPSFHAVTACERGERGEGGGWRVA